MRAVAALLLSAQVALADTLVEPTVVQCNNKNPLVTLEIKQARWNAGGHLAFNARLYHLNGVAMVPGPTIEMKAGEKCQINIVNSLTNTQGSQCPYHANTPHCPDSTNLHTHGLHVSPDDDAVYTHVGPGKSLTYTYNVPESHLPGTHWYHAHHHGSTSIQVMGGLAGGLIMKPADSYSLPDDLVSLYDNAKVMVFQHIHFNGRDTVLNTPGAFGLLDYSGIASSFPQSTFAVNVTYTSKSSPREFVLINGQYKPSISVRANEPTLIRFVTAMGMRTIEMEFARSGCTMHLIARDGVFQYVPYAELTVAGFVPGTRADIMVTCGLDVVGQTVTVASVARASRNLIYSTENRISQDLFDIIVEAPLPGVAAASVPSTQAKLPAYLDNLYDGRTSNYGTSLVFAGGSLNDLRFEGFDGPIASRYLAQFCLDKTYDIYIGSPKTTYLPKSAAEAESLELKRRSLPAAPAKMTNLKPAAGRGRPGQKLSLTTNENNVNNEGVSTTAELVGGIHVYHHHINHFQVRSLDGVEMDPGILRTGEWRDVVPAFDTGVQLRFKPVDFVGEQVIHCHIVEHEDMGMMGLYNIAKC